MFAPRAVVPPVKQLQPGWQPAARKMIFLVNIRFSLGDVVLALCGDSLSCTTRGRLEADCYSRMTKS